MDAQGCQVMGIGEERLCHIVKPASVQAVGIEVSEAVLEGAQGGIGRGAVDHLVMAAVFK